MYFQQGKGICQNSWRKWMRYPRRLRVPSLNKIAQEAVRPSPLWEFRAANCFRDFIVASQNENPRWSGPSYLNRITGTRRSVSKGLYVSVFCTSWMQEDTPGKSEMMMILSKSLMKPSTNLCSQSNIAALLSLRYDKWFSLWNEYDLPFEMRICTCEIKPFGSLQVVIRLGEWQAAGSRIRQAWDYESRCQNYPFDMINDCHFEMIYDSPFESRAVSIGRQSDRNGSETRSESRD